MADDRPTSAYERASAVWLFRLNAVPRWLFVIVLAATLLAGLLLDNAFGGVLLLILALFLGWLASIGWHHQSLAAKALRVITVALLVVAGASRLV